MPPVNFPVSILQTYETHFPVDKVVLYLSGAYNAPKTKTLKLPKRNSVENRHTLIPEYTGLTLTSTNFNAILQFIPAYTLYGQKGGKEWMSVGITSSAATQIMSDDPGYSSTINEG